MRLTDGEDSIFGRDLAKVTFLSVLAAVHPGVALAAASSTKKPVTGFGAWGMWVILGLMFLVMYFVLYRPQKKRAAEAQDMLAELEKGDEVMTIGGIHGIVKKLSDDTVVVEVDRDVRMTFSRSAIARNLTVREAVEEEEESAEEDEEDE